MKLTTPLQTNLICILLGIVMGAVGVGFFLTDKISELERQRASENTAKGDEIAALVESADIGAVKQARRRVLQELSPPLGRLLENLSDWGYWAPGQSTFVNGEFRMARARYKGSSPSKHSYRVLTDVGALKNDTQGYVILYTVLATEADKERGRKSVAGMEISSEAGESLLKCGSGDLDALFANSDAAREMLGQLQAFQAILIKYKDDLIAEGHLTK